MSERRIYFNIRLDMLSDWSVGSGGGRQGALDSVVVRDADNLPYVPATTLRGIWRDAAEQVAFALDSVKLKQGPSHDRTDCSWCMLVDFLFGSHPAIDGRGARGEGPIPGRLMLDDARLPSSLRAALRDIPMDHGGSLSREALRNALTLVKPGVAIDQRSGRAKTNFLRFEEVARQGAVLVANASILLTGEKDADEALICLAFAATRMVERVGGNRRRGAGRCRMTTGGAKVVAADPGLPATVDAAVDRLPAVRSLKMPTSKRNGLLEIKFVETAKGDLVIVPLDIEIESPTVVAESVLGNVVTSLDYIPGTMLLAAVAGMLGETGMDKGRISAAFAVGDIRVLPAYPVVAGQRALPVPFAFRGKKSDHDQIKIVRDRFMAFRWGTARGWGRDGDQKRELELAFGSPSRVTRTHNTVEDAFQTPTEAVGGVYSYEALPAGTRLRSELWIRKALFEARLADSLEAVNMTVGRAKKSGYGSVRLTPGSGSRAPEPPATAPCEGFNLYAASDILLPAAPVKAAVASPAAFLCAAIRQVTGVNVTIVAGEVRTSRSDGWIARWGLPRPSYAVIRAGSSITVKALSDEALFSPDQLATLEREGLGGRRGEGFGHVLINPPFLATPLKDSIKLEVPENTAPYYVSPGVSDYADFARTIESAAVREAIKLRVELVAADTKDRKERLGWIREKPNMSQLGSLRAVMGGLQTDGDLDRAKRFIVKLKETDRASKWGGSNPNAENHPLTLLEQFFDAPHTIWKTIRFDENEDREWESLLLDRQPSRIRGDSNLQRFAIANFLFAAMRAHKRAMESAGVESVEPQLAIQEG